MCLHDNTKQIMVKFHALKGRWFKYLVYWNDFNDVLSCLNMFDWVQKLNGIKHSCMRIFGVHLPTQIILITAFDPVQFTKQLGM